MGYGEALIYDVSEPTLGDFRPIAGQGNETFVIVVPDGGYLFGAGVLLTPGQRLQRLFQCRAKRCEVLGSPTSIRLPRELWL